MIRFFFRLLATLVLAGAVIMGVLDATRTVAAGALVMTPLGESWSATFPASLASLQAFMQAKANWLWDPVLTTVLELPGFAMLGTLAFLLYAIGHKPEHLRDEWA
ncbi:MULTISPECIES: hypothetical protein [Mesorhizobium]|uniref:PetM family of cytochrome b6f complex subunit 7 n=1 Tax=Mesorhizobium denitrificans TaxID=2294114 RepID=A0A371XJT2_9HYPH|nr:MULTISPECIES: hypothetical protein [Mesorhizobium]RFC69463.1 hypothetical protein DY251_01660 [Mesorhizobium denitrificans]